MDVRKQVNKVPKVRDLQQKKAVGERFSAKFDETGS